MVLGTNSDCYFTHILSCEGCIAPAKASSPESTIVCLQCGKTCVIVQLDAITPYVVTAFYNIKYSVIQKDGLNFVSLYFKIRTSYKYDVNYI